MKNIQPKLILVISAVAVAALFRLIPHWPNFTPMASIALMGGALVANRFMGFIIPLIALVISDVLTIKLINYQWITVEDYFSSPSTLLLYLGFIAIIAIGFLLRKRHSWTNLASASLASALIFFLISNFGVWLGNSLPKTFVGLLATFELGIPFFSYNLLGNVFYTFLFFGIFHFIYSKNPNLAKETVRK